MESDRRRPAAAEEGRGAANHARTRGRAPVRARPADPRPASAAVGGAGSARRRGRARVLSGRFRRANHCPRPTGRPITPPAGCSCRRRRRSWSRGLGLGVHFTSGPSSALGWERPPSYVTGGAPANCRLLPTPERVVGRLSAWLHANGQHISFLRAPPLLGYAFLAGPDRSRHHGRGQGHSASVPGDG